LPIDEVVILTSEKESNFLGKFKIYLSLIAFENRLAIWISTEFGADDVESHDIDRLLLFSLASGHTAVIEKRGKGHRINRSKHCWE
jgi:hypothetical protein